MEDPAVEGDPAETVTDDEVTEETPENEKMILKAGTNIRAAADGMSEIIATLEEDTEAEVLDAEGDWVRVSVSEEIQGWVFRNGDEAAPQEPEEEPAEEEPAEEVPAEDTEEPAEPEPVVVIPAEKKVTIFTSRRTQMEVGEDIVLTSLLEGFEDCSNIKYQWECDKGSGYAEVEGAVDATYTYPASEESMGWSWRLIVLYM